MKCLPVSRDLVECVPLGRVTFEVGMTEGDQLGISNLFEVADVADDSPTMSTLADNIILRLDDAHQFIYT